MTVEALAAEATNQATIDVSNIPASAFPEGADPAAYVAGLSAQNADGEATASDTPVRPAHIQEKFWNAETGTVDTDALAKSYAELEQRLRTPKTEGDEGLKIGKTENEVTEASNPLTTAFEAFETAYDSTGTASDEDVAAIVKLGVPEKMVANYVAGIEALKREGERNAADAAGGADKFNDALEWGKANLQKADADVYDSLIEAGKIQQGVQWLMDRYNSANPSEGTFVEAQSGGISGDVFRSKAEMIAEMNDPRYARDEAFRLDVANKVARSKAAKTL